MPVCASPQDRNRNSTLVNPKCAKRFHRHCFIAGNWHYRRTIGLLSCLLCSLVPSHLDRFDPAQHSIRTRSETYTYKGAGGGKTFNDFGFGDKDGYIDYVTNTTRQVGACLRLFVRAVILIFLINDFTSTSKKQQHVGDEPCVIRDTHGNSCYCCCCCCCAMQSEN